MVNRRSVTNYSQKLQNIHKFHNHVFYVTEDIDNKNLPIRSLDNIVNTHLLSQIWNKKGPGVLARLKQQMAKWFWTGLG